MHRFRLPQRLSDLESLRSFYWVIWMALLVVALPNLLMWWVSARLGIPRAPIDLDYLITAAAIVLIGRTAGFLAFTLAVLLDLMAAFLPIFGLNFVGSKWQVLWLALSHWSSSKILIIVGSIIATTGILVLAAGRPSMSRKCRLQLTGLLIALGLVISTIEYGFLLWDHSLSGAHFHRQRLACTRMSRETYYWLRDYFSLRATGEYMPIVRGGAATWKYFDRRTELSERATPASLRAVGGGRPNVLLVLVESLGCLKADPGRRKLFAPLWALEAKYEIESGEIQFHGNTCQGEMRELTWRVPQGLVDRNAPRLSLPNWFLTRGYRTLAIHGFTGRFGDRLAWYPLVGFSQALFLDDFFAANPNLELQGSLFQGASDRLTAEEVHKHLLIASRAHIPLFLHWMTLSSHFPVDSSYAEACRPLWFQLEGVPSTICALERIQGDTINLISRIAVDPKLAPTDIIVVGDHPPPLPSLQDRQCYVEGQVPYVILRSRLAAPAP